MDQNQNLSKTQKKKEIRELKKKIDKKRKECNDQRLKFQKQERDRERAERFHNWQLEEIIQEQQKVLEEATMVSNYCFLLNKTFIFGPNDILREIISKDVTNGSIATQNFKRQRPANQEEKQEKQEKQYNLEQKGPEKKLKKDEGIVNGEMKTEKFERVIDRYLTKKQNKEQQVQQVVIENAAQEKQQPISDNKVQNPKQQPSEQQDPNAGYKALLDNKPQQPDIDEYEPDVDPNIGPQVGYEYDYSPRPLDQNNSELYPPELYDDYQDDQQEASPEEDVPKPSLGELEEYKEVIQMQKEQEQALFKDLDQAYLYPIFPQDYPHHPRGYIQMIRKFNSSTEISYGLMVKQLYVTSIHISRQINIPQTAHYLNHYKAPVQMQELVKYHWHNLIGMRFICSKLNNQDFKLLSKNTKLYPLLKILYLSCNSKFTTLTAEMLSKFKNLEYIHFGDQGNCDLTKQSIEEVKKYKISHPHVYVVCASIQRDSWYKNKKIP